MQIYLGGAENTNNPKIECWGFRPLINPYWFKEASMAIKILQSLGIDLQEILHILWCDW